MINVIAKIKQYGLKECIRGFLRIIDRKIGYPFSYLNYIWCLLLGKTYFGQYLAAKQGGIRYLFMQKITCNINDKAIKVLEIGSWGGGSAIAWAEAIKKYNPHGGEVCCIDPWVPYIDTQLNKNSTHKAMTRALRKNKIFNLFQHNIYASGYGGMIFSFRGSSSNRLPMLKENQFDIVYIDGDHCYSSVFNDLRMAAPLVLEGGILCGDDLELQYPYIDVENAEKNKQYDFIIDPKTQEYFHPGVSLAVYELFRQEVSEWHGFWAMQKLGDRWERIDLEFYDAAIEIPQHLK